MHGRLTRKRVTTALLSSLLALPAMAEEGVQWQYGVAPYLWMLGLHGTVQAANTRLEVSQSFADIMQKFQGGIMLWLDARRGRFGLFANSMFSVLKDEQTVEGFPVRARNDFGIFSAGASWSLIGDASKPQGLTLDALAGARLTLNDVTLRVADLRAVSNHTWTDPIGGARLRYTFNPQWHVIGEADGGGINGHHSTDVQGWIGYNPKKPWLVDNLMLYLGYRNLNQYYTSGEGRNFFLWDMNIRGPIIGAKAIF